MTFDALKHRDIPEVYRMLEGLVCLMAVIALVIRERAQINRMLEGTRLH